MSTHIPLLVHAIKAIQYRFVKATNASKVDFGSYKISDHARTPSEIVNHLFDLAAKTRCMITYGHFDSPLPTPLSFPEEAQRFLSGLETLACATIEEETGKRLLQGPVLDMATHVGQLAMLNGLHGTRVAKENYYSAHIN